MTAGNTSVLSYCKRKLWNANCMPIPIHQDGLLQNFAPSLRRALYMIQLIKSFSCCWNLTNIANDSDLNLCRIAQPFTWEDAMSVLLRAAVWYLRIPYTPKVHRAEKRTSLKKKNHVSFPCLMNPRSLMNHSKDPVPAPSPARLMQCTPKHGISLRRNFIFPPFTPSTSSKNVHIYHLSHSSNAMRHVHLPSVGYTRNTGYSKWLSFNDLSYTIHLR